MFTYVCGYELQRNIAEVNSAGKANYDNVYTGRDT